MKLVFNVILFANDNKQREKGLMFHEPIEDNEAAVFAFDYPGNYSFWNKNVSFDLSVAFLDETGQILEIQDIPAFSERSITPQSTNVRFVIETNRGTFKQKQLKAGDRLHLANNELYADK